jgi:hypothetical protein
MIRIYADFNGLQASRRNPSLLAVPLDTYGSLRDLANLGIRLVPDLPLIIYDWSDEEEDLEGYASVYWDSVSQTWIAELDARGVQYVPKRLRDQSQSFLCIHCRTPLHEIIHQKGLNPASTCPECGTQIHTPIAPPDDTITEKENNHLNREGH